MLRSEAVRREAAGGRAKDGGAAPRPGRPSWSWPAALAVGAAAVAAAARLRYLDLPLERDEGEYAYAARMLLEGAPLLQTVHHMKAPGVYAAYAAILAALGPSAAALRFGLIVVNTATARLVWLMGGRLWGRTAGGAAAAAFSILSASPSVLGLAAHATHFVLPFALGGLLLLLPARAGGRVPGPGRLFLSGLLLGLAPLMKQHGALFAAFGSVWLARELLAGGAGAGVGGAGGGDAPGAPPLPRRLRPGWPFALGLALPAAALLAALGSSGGLGPLWFWGVAYPLAYSGQVGWGEGLALLTRAGRGLAAASPALWLLAAAGLWRALAARGRARGAFLLGLALASFLATCPGLYFRPHYFILLLPAAALLAGAALARWSRLLASALPRPRAAWAAAGLAVLAVASPAWSQRRQLFGMRPAELSRAAYGPNPFVESAAVGRFLRERARPGDRLAVLGSEPQILFYSGLRSATGYLYAYPLMERHPAALALQQGLIEEVEAAAPEFLVLAHLPYSWLARPDSQPLVLRWLERYAREGYEVVGLVDIFWPRRTEYRWGKEASARQPASPLHLVVYERRDRGARRGGA